MRTETNDVGRQSMYILQLAAKVRAFCGGLGQKDGQSAKAFATEHFGAVFCYVEREITNPETLGNVISCAVMRRGLNYRGLGDSGPCTTLMEVTGPVPLTGHADGTQYQQHVAAFVILAAIYDYNRISRRR